MSNVGKIIKGYCNGYFGRDDYEDKAIVFETKLGICCRYIDSYKDAWDKLTSCNFESEEEKNELILKWEKER